MANTNSAVSVARVEEKRSSKGKWVLALNVAYYLLPIAYGLFIISIVTLGHDWFLKATWFFNWINPFSSKLSDGMLPIAVMYRLCLVVLIYVMIRTFYAMAIPPERTFDQNVDMALSLVPIAGMAYVLGKWHFQGFQIGLIEWYFLLFAFWASVLLDFFGARLAQKLISAYRRRVDIV